MAKKRANGEGNIRKRKDGRWEGRYSAGYDPETGKRSNKNVRGKTQAEVKEKPAQAQQETVGLDVARSEDYTVATWLRSWYELYAKPNVRPATADRYHLIIETYTIPRIGKIKLKKLTFRDLQKLYKDLMEHGRVQKRSGKGNPGLSSTTVRSVHLTLHCAFERAVKERLIPRTPTNDCIAPKVQKVEMKTLLPEHLKSYPDAANTRDVLPMFYLELVSGLRKGELVALLWGDLDAEHKTDLRQQAVRSQPKWSGDTLQAKDRDLGAAGIHPAGCGEPADPGTQQAPRQPVHVSLAGHRRDVPPGLRGEAPRKDTKGRRTGAHPLPRPAPRVRYQRSGAWDGCKDPVHHHRARLQCHYAECLRTRH